MANGGKITAFLDLDASGVRRGSQEAVQAIQNIENNLDGMQSSFKSLEKIGTGLTVGLTLPLVGFAKTSIDTAKEFEYSMSEVQAISGATGDDLKKLEEQAKELGATTFYSAQEASQGMKYYAMAGYEVNEIMDAMPASIDLAVASNTDLASVCDIVSDAMTGLKMSSEETTRFTDILAKTATSTNTTVEMLGESFRYSSATAGMLGINAEDLSIALGLMANAGTKSTVAGNNLKTGLLRLSAPTEKMTKAMEKYNIELKTNEDGSVNLLETMSNMRTQLKNLDEVTQANVLSTIMGKDATAGWAGIINASEEDFKSLTEEIYNCNNTAKEMSDIMGDNLQGKLKSLESSFEGVKIAVGEILIPVIEKFVEGLTNVFTWFNELDDGSKKMIVGFGGFLAVLGPIMLLLPKLIKGFGLVKAGFIALKGGVGLTGSALLTFKLVLASIGIALVGFMAYIGSSSDMLQSLQDNFGTFGVVVGGICEFLYGTFQLTFGNIGILISTLGKMLMALMKGNFKEVGNIWKDGWAKMEVNTAKAGSNIAGHTTNSIKKIREMSSEELTSLEGHFNTTMETLKTVTADNIDEATAIFVNSLEDMDNDTINTLKGTSDSMALLFSGISANMTDTQATNVFKGNLEAMVRSGELSLSQLEADTEEFSKIVANNISTGAHQVEIAGKELWTNFKDVSTRGIDEVSLSMANDIQNMNQETFASLQGISDTWGQAFNGITDISSMSTQEIADIVKANYTDMGMSAEDIMKAMEEDMNTYLSSMSETSSAEATNISTNLTEGLSGASNGVSNEMSNINNTLQEGLSNASNTASNGGNTIKNNIVNSTTGTKEAVQNNVNVSDVVKNEVNDAVSASANASQIKNNITAGTNGIGATVQSNVSGVSKAVNEGTKNATQVADNNTKGMKNAVDKNTKELSKSAEKNFKAINTSAKTNFTTATEQVKRDATSMYNGAKTSFSKLADSGISSITRLKESVINQTAIMKNSAISNWESIRSAYSKSITGTVTINKVEKTTKTLSSNNEEKSLLRSLYSLDNNDLIARQEAMASLSNIEVGGKMAVSSTDNKKEDIKEKKTTEKSNNITYNYTYTSPKESSISELRRKDRVQAQRLALSFK